MNQNDKQQAKETCKYEHDLVIGSNSYGKTYECRYCDFKTDKHGYNEWYCDNML